MAATHMIVTSLAMSYILALCHPTVVFSEYPIRARHAAWMTSHGRVYEAELEKERRFMFYESNYRLIRSFNARNLGYHLADNKFADMNKEEFEAKYLNLGRGINLTSNEQDNGTDKSLQEQSVHIDMTSLPRSIDWRRRGAVTGIKDQGKCGGCWAFSAVAAVEGITYIKTGALVPLSEQELLDCDNSTNFGCRGGLMTKAFNFIMNNNGLATLSDYPYVGTPGACRSGKLFSNAATITGYRNVTPATEDGLLAAVASQPVSVAMDASTYHFRFFAGGVFTGPCGTQINHAVTAVGYGMEGHTRYWIMKNSWGSDWGERGYFRIQREVDDSKGLCGIAIMASYPTLD